ncbi:MAG: hypothetical protein V7742_22495 [Halioglobus sp.]
MKNNAFKVSLLASFLVPMGAIAAPATVVYDAYSLRAALDSGATKIVIKAGATDIEVSQTLEYVGTAPLSINGNGRVIYGDILGDGPILQLTNGADLSISNLSFEGPGGYSIEAQGGGKGIYVQVPIEREGVVNVKLSNVSVSHTGNHGVHVSDCSLGDDCGGGAGGGGEGSPASIRVQLNGVTIDGAGFGQQDADGLRVDDRGEGDIILSATDSTFINVGGDGIELDEGNEGSVVINVRNSDFTGNGAYCSADLLVDDPIALDPKCDDDGDPDVDDAFDIDEAGPGGISGMVANLSIIDNYDEGLDFDSEGNGEGDSVDLDIMNIFAQGNADEAIKVSEEGNASVAVNLRAIDVEGDVEIEEEDVGELRVSVNGSFIGDDLKLSEKGAGTGTAKLRGTTVVDESDFNNVTEI